MVLALLARLTFFVVIQNGIRSCLAPDDPQALYFRRIFHVFFYGPFYAEAELVAAMRKLDAECPRWDWHGIAVHHGRRPLTDDTADWPYCLPYVRQEERTRIEIARRARPLVGQIIKPIAIGVATKQKSSV